MARPRRSAAAPIEAPVSPPVESAPVASTPPDDFGVLDDLPRAPVSARAAPDPFALPMGFDPTKLGVPEEERVETPAAPVKPLTLAQAFDVPTPPVVDRKPGDVSFLRLQEPIHVVKGMGIPVRLYESISTVDTGSTRDDIMLARSIKLVEHGARVGVGMLDGKPQAILVPWARIGYVGFTEGEEHAEG